MVTVPMGALWIGQFKSMSKLNNIITFNMDTLWIN